MDKYNKSKIKKWECIKLKSVYISKEIWVKIKNGTLSNRRKYLNNESDKGLISKIQKTYKAYQQRN